ncbi:MAG: hypothetical protein CL709_01690 [Chloroflexi bacterium]|nr:hypothetical protein [Chloroflexota bacterium]
MPEEGIESSNSVYCASERVYLVEDEFHRACDPDGIVIGGRVGVNEIGMADVKWPRGNSVALRKTSRLPGFDSLIRMSICYTGSVPKHR